MTRQEKIKLLRGIASGEIKIEDIKPKKLVYDIFYDGENSRYYIDGKEVSADECVAQSKKQRVGYEKDPNLEIIFEGLSLNDPDYVAKWKAQP